MKLEELSAVELGKLVSSKSISPVEVIRYFADRIEARNKSINAFTYTRFDEAIERAKELESKILHGEKTGPLSGVPVALKDFLPSKKGWTNSHGGVRSLIAADPEDSVFTSSAERLGAIAIGKTNAPAFAFRGTCDNKLYGPTSTPFNTEYNSGGSSGGSAAAVADGMVPIAEGSDGGGSIRIPSAWCGCFGFKASVGTIPSVCRPDAWTATHPYCFNGAITRTVTDSAIMLGQMAYYDPRDPLSIERPSRDFTELMKNPLTGLKIGYTPDFGIFEVDPVIEKVTREAAFRLTEAGAEVEEASFDLHYSANDFADMWCRSISIDTSTDIERWKKEGFDLIGEHREELPEEFIYWNDIALNSTTSDYRLFNEMRTDAYDMQRKAFERYDIILSPVTVCSPVKNAYDGNTKGPAEVNGIKTEQLIGFCETFFFNYTGNPAASVPCGYDGLGLPVGLQIVGKRFRDEDVFAVADKIEKIMPWSYDIPFNRRIKSE